MSRSFTLVQLRYFAVVAETENMTEAAKHLNISQSALSTAISQLEREMKAQLFIRGRKRGIVLSQAGRRLAHEIRLFLEQADRLFDVAHGVTDELSGELTVGVFAPIAAYRAPIILRDFERIYPRVHVSFIEGNLDDLRNEMLAGHCELALIYDIGVTEDMDVSVIDEIGPHAIVPAGHPLAKSPNKRVSLADLAPEPFILLDLPRTREYFFQLFESQALTPSVRHRVTGYETVRSYVAAGLGVSVLNQRIPRDWTYVGEDIVSLELEGDLRPIRLVVARPRGVELTRRALAFEEVARRPRTQPIIPPA